MQLLTLTNCCGFRLWPRGLLNKKTFCAWKVKKVKVTLEQVMKAQKGSRLIDLLFLLPRRKMEVDSKDNFPAALLPGKRFGTHYMVG
jgi:hypothetical protein